MSTVVVDQPGLPPENKATIWGGGRRPFAARYGKLMMWFFLISDSFTFGGLLISYGLVRISHDWWPDPDIVFNAAPFLGSGYPLVFVGVMTFILIASSLTMVLAVEYGHQRKRWKTAWYLFLTILGGATFLGCQAWEWNHLWAESHDGYVIQQNFEGKPFAEANELDASDYTIELVAVNTSPFGNYWGQAYEYTEGGKLVKLENKDFAEHMSKGHDDHGHAHAMPAQPKAGDVVLTQGPPPFSQFFFAVTGFHGFHVFSGVLLLIILFGYVVSGYFDRKGRDYEMVEKIGLYWHFVDLVWVFVFTFYYLV